MIGIAHASGADVILVGVPQPSLLLKPPRFYKTLAKEHAIPFDGDTLPGIIGSVSLKSDQLHPNAAGYRLLAEAIAELIQRSQAAH